MEKICDLARINTDLQREIDSLKHSIDNLEVVNSGDICWADCVVLDIVINKLREEVELKVWEKDLKKKEMTNVLVQALPQ